MLTRKMSFVALMVVCLRNVVLLFTYPRRRKADYFSLFPNGEWPATLSLSLYDELQEYYSSDLFKKDAQPGTALWDVMSHAAYLAEPTDTLRSLEKKFEHVSGMPVIENETCVGVISKSDAIRANWKGDVRASMSAPPITCAPNALVVDAAALMLKYKIGRVPVVNSKKKVVGIVSRSDIFTALSSFDGI